MLARTCLAAAVAFTSVGCNAYYVRRDVYDRDVVALKEYAGTLERRNTDLETRAQTLDKIEDLNLIGRTQDELYQQIAEGLKRAFAAVQHNGDGGMTYDPRRGAWTAGTDLLFDSGTWTISARGIEVLKKFAEAYRGQPVRFRIVGHTDRAPIAKAKTKDALETDTNSELSCRRAIAVMGQLKKFGIAEGQFIECVGMGNAQPVAANDRNPANMKQNRRVEIFVLK